MGQKFLVSVSTSILIYQTHNGWGHRRKLITGWISHLQRLHSTCVYNSAMPGWSLVLRFTHPTYSFPKKQKDTPNPQECLTNEPYLDLIFMFWIWRFQKVLWKKKTKQKSPKGTFFFTLLRKKKRRLHIYCYWREAILEEREWKDIQLQLFWEVLISRMFFQLQQTKVSFRGKKYPKQDYWHRYLYIKHIKVLKYQPIFMTAKIKQKANIQNTLKPSVFHYSTSNCREEQKYILASYVLPTFRLLGKPKSHSQKYRSSGLRLKKK